MTYDPTANYQFGLGHVLEPTPTFDLGADPFFAQHDGRKYTFEHLRESQYCPYLGQTGSDGYSQSSGASEESSSQNSDWAPLSPSSNSSEHNLDNVAEDNQDVLSHPSTSQAHSTAANRRLCQASECAPPPQQSAPGGLQHGQSTNVAYRPKVITSTQTQQVNLKASSNTSSSTPHTVVSTQNGMPLQTQNIASDVRRSRMHIPADAGQDFPQHSRRGRSVGAAALPPPSLRRDTDHTDALVKMIVVFCTQLISSIWSTGTAFGTDTSSGQSASNVLPLQVFITETLRRSKTSYSTLQIALYYLILLKQCLPLSVSGGQSGCRAMQCGRRMFLTALILASKYLQDRNYSARAWSKISGLPLKEVNDNERRFLNMVCWDLHVPKATFENWSKIVLSMCRLSITPAAGCKSFDTQPPGPGTGPLTQGGCPFQTMYNDNMTAWRSWWCTNLQKLRTTIVGDCHKTTCYINTIAKFRDEPYLPKPVGFPTPPEDYADTFLELETQCLMNQSRQSSTDCASRVLRPAETVDDSATDTSMPPPPAFKNLPTPQTTPRSDMSSMWTPKAVMPSLRCRASASALANIDRSCHPMANLETCPPPMPRSQYAWSALQSAQEVPDRSLTSSPESVVSDFFSLPGRSRSSSISSTTSWATSASGSSILDTNKEQLEQLPGALRAGRMQQAQQRISQFRQQSIFRRPAPSAMQPETRPQTAFRVSDLRCKTLNPLVQAETFVDEGYGSDDYAKKKREQCRQEEQEAAQALLTFQNLDSHREATTRPCLDRSNTQYWAIPQNTNSKIQALKRSRSESFDVKHDHCLSHNSGWRAPTVTLQRSEDQWSICDQQPTDQLCAMVKDVQQPTQDWAESRMPVQCGAQNKRLALEMPVPNAAADCARHLLRQDFSLQRLDSVIV